MKIESLQNKQVKELVQLYQKSRTRKQQQLFVLEGAREFQMAYNSGYLFEKIFICPSFIKDEDFNFIKDSKLPTIELSEEVYQKVSYRGSTEGILAIAKFKNHTLKNLNLPENPLILVVESIEKPGNLGAMLRTADATQIDAVLIADPTVDIYNPNVIRSSIGCVFSQPIAVADSPTICNYLEEKNISIYSAILQEAVSYDTQNYQTPTAIVVGSEANGLSDIWREKSTQNIIIPMEGLIDSMNVSVAAAVLLFEAKRQRKQIAK